MDVEEFNRLPAAEAGSVLLAAAAIPGWATAVADGRPYADAPDLIARAVTAMESWTHADVETALADHPRIGEKHSGDGASAAMSSTEQSGVDAGDAALMARLADGNRRYEELFGRIYLVRARGRSAAELLDLLEQRLLNDIDTELDVTTGELKEIAELRLEALFE